LGDVLDGVLGPKDLLIENQGSLDGQAPVVPAVNGELVTERGHLDNQVSVGADMGAEQEERRPHASACKKVEESGGASRIRAVIEGERHMVWPAQSMHRA
jgi:hypothetical protein